MFHPKYHHRQSTRLKGFDYASNGAYFITICVHERRPLFGTIANDQMQLNDAGRAIEAEWRNLATRFPHLVIDELTIMPNHLHGILALAGAECMSDTPRTGEPRVRPASQVESAQSAKHPTGTAENSISRILQAFKSLSTNRYIAGVKQSNWPRFTGHLWHRNYYDHIIRNEKSLDRIRQYIATNPQRWATDHENPDGDRTDDVERFIRLIDKEFLEPVEISREGEHEVRPYGGSRAR